MKKLVILLFTLICLLPAAAQDYVLSNGGNEGHGGRYLVKVTAIVKQNTDYTDFLIRSAVDGVMFRGVPPENGYGAHSALIADPNIADVKADFFTAFNNEGKYRIYGSLVPESLYVTKLKKKKAEISALVLVDKEALTHYLEECQIINGMSDLW